MGLLPLPPVVWLVDLELMRAERERAMPGTSGLLGAGGLLGLTCCNAVQMLA